MFAVAGRMNPNWQLATFHAAPVAVAPQRPRRPLSSVARFASVGHGACCDSCAHGGPCEGTRAANPPKGQSCCESCALGMPCEGGCGAACTCGKEGPSANPACNPPKRGCPPGTAWNYRACRCEQRKISAPTGCDPRRDPLCGITSTSGMNLRMPNGFGLMHAQQTMGARRFHNPRWGLASR